MTSAEEPLANLFRLSESFFLGDATAERAILELHRDLRGRGEAVVEQGFLCMRALLQELVSGHEDALYETLDAGEWRVDGGGGLSGSKIWPPTSQLRTYPSLAELSRHLSHWVRGFIPVVSGLGTVGEDALFRCLESRDYQLATLATILLGDDSFNYVWDAAQLRLSINRCSHVVQGLELGRILFQRYSDLEALRELVVPILIFNSSFDLLAEDHALRKDVLLYLREVTIWDIATDGRGPRTKWPTWWR